MTEQLEPGDINIHDSATPGLQDGAYQVTVKTTVQESHDPARAGWTVRQDFTEARTIEVPGSAYRLDPAEIVAAQPPPGGAGAYSTCLPFVVLRRRTLPWERYVGPGADTTPWLALLLLDEGEGTFTRDAAAPDGRPGATVTVPEQVLRTILPRRAEIGYLCHVRQTAPRDATDDGWAAVVTANRLPVSGPTQHACLVSLAGSGAIVDAVERGQPLPPSPVTFPLLYDWSFQVGAGGTFERVVTDLAGRAAAFEVTADRPVRLAHTHRDGTPGVALYHGPIVGRLTDPAVPGEGETDVSLAAAETLGRLLASADRSLVRELSEWRRRDSQPSSGTFRAAPPGPAAVARLADAVADPWEVPETVRRLHAAEAASSETEDRS